MKFHLMCVYNIFVRFSCCILTICKIIISRFGFEGWIGVLIASVPDLCMLLLLIVLVIVLLTGSK